MNVEFAGLTFNVFELIKTTVPAEVIFIVGGVILVGIVYYYLRKMRFKSATIKYSDIRIVKRAGRTRRQRYRFILMVLRVAAVGSSSLWDRVYRGNVRRD